MVSLVYLMDHQYLLLLVMAVIGIGQLALLVEELLVLELI